jgi:energy-coupling factor transporter ATP-binding protein EcfA2
MNQFPNVLIVGPSGSGKSSCLRNLNPAETGIVNGERKALPFKNAKLFTNEVECGNLLDYTNGIRKFNTDTAIKQVVVESFTSYDEMCLGWCRGQYKGYDIYSVHNSMIRDFIKESKLKDKICIFTGIDEIVGIDTPNGSKVSRRALKVEGRELQGTIEKEFTIVLFTEVVKNGSTFDYKLCTNTDGVNAAKSPIGMFASQYIPNDLSFVISTIKKYYE